MSTAGIHAGWNAVEDGHGALTVPVYGSSAYAQASHSALKALFQRRAEGFAYSRSGNPTTAVLEQRITALEKGIGAIAVASGQAATSIALCALAAPGGHVVASSRLYGGTTEFLDDTLADLGVTFTVADPWDLAAWEAAFTPATRAAIVESIANPGAQLVDLTALTAIAHDHDVPVIVDSTLASPALYRPGEHGADLVVHSATKYLCGHGTTIAGLIVDTGRFDPRRRPERWRCLTAPNRRFGVTFADEYAHGGSGLLAYAAPSTSPTSGPPCPPRAPSRSWWASRLSTCGCGRSAPTPQPSPAACTASPTSRGSSTPTSRADPTRTSRSGTSPTAPPACSPSSSTGERPRPRRSAMRCGYGPSR